VKARDGGAKRMLVEWPLPQDESGRARRRARPARSVTLNLAESPLAWLLAHGHIDRRQFAAGEQLRSDWEAAGLAPAVTMNWEAPPIGKTPRGPPSPAALGAGRMAARRRFDAAVEAVGRELADILWRIVCSGDAMRDAELALGWPARAGKVILRLALDRLAEHYRLR
jgi:hypothetical protein